MLHFSLGLALAAPMASARADVVEMPVETLLKKMRTAYMNVSSAQLAVRLQVADGNGSTSGYLTLDYSRPNRIRYASRVGETETRRYSDGKRVVTIRPGSRQIEPTVNVNSLGGQVVGNLEWLCFFDWKRQLSTTPGANMAKSRLKIGPAVQWRGRTWILLEETAEQQGVFVRYTIDPKTFFIWRCEWQLLSNKKQVSITEVQKLTLGASLPASKFTPPADPNARRTGRP